MNMNINNIQQSNPNFKGYDAIKLKGFYMQGLIQPCEKRIFHEMKQIAQKEGLDLFINQNNTGVKTNLLENILPDQKLSIWGQDRKAFIKKNNSNTILENTCETILNETDFKPIGQYKILAEKYIPRGGNYYIGYNNNGEKWLLLNAAEIYDKKAFNEFGDKPTKELFSTLFEINPKNIFVINEFFTDLDEVIRPIGYPYVLVNNYSENLKNIKKLEQKFPESKELIKKLRDYSEKRIHENHSEALKSYGFIPINISANYLNDINFINAIAFKNKNNKLSYITNSTKNSYPELEYLEQLFEEDLRKKVKDIEQIHFVSGGKKDVDEPDSDILTITLPSFGLKKGNTIMDILANRHGGIHCMTAEIPLEH
ncbi:hypothetical protein HDR58_04240 [bacterium]|nr:hypothetical protein [bacterium]